VEGELDRALDLAAELGAERRGGAKRASEHAGQAGEEIAFGGAEWNAEPDHDETAPARLLLACGHHLAVAEAREPDGALFRSCGAERAGSGLGAGADGGAQLAGDDDRADLGTEVPHGPRRGALGGGPLIVVTAHNPEELDQRPATATAHARLFGSFSDSLN
jgi:hypothetical protein